MRVRVAPFHVVLVTTMLPWVGRDTARRLPAVFSVPFGSAGRMYDFLTELPGTYRLGAPCLASPGAVRLALWRQSEASSDTSRRSGHEWWYRQGGEQLEFRVGAVYALDVWRYRRGRRDVEWEDP